MFILTRSLLEKNHGIVKGNAIEGVQVRAVKLTSFVHRFVLPRCSSSVTTNTFPNVRHILKKKMFARLLNTEYLPNPFPSWPISIERRLPSFFVLILNVSTFSIKIQLLKILYQCLEGYIFVWVSSETNSSVIVENQNN